MSIRSWVLFSTLCGSFNTKSMVVSVSAQNIYLFINYSGTSSSARQSSTGSSYLATTIGTWPERTQDGGSWSRTVCSNTRGSMTWSCSRGTPWGGMGPRWRHFWSTPPRARLSIKLWWKTSAFLIFRYFIVTLIATMWFWGEMGVKISYVFMYGQARHAIHL
jgi:hypothetical protein